jgi:(p)ppGpp synthase/HD superfamily hydrolase
MAAAPTIQDAREFAMARHDGQIRLHDRQPYIAHLDGVAAILADYGHRQPEVIAAAYLHDTLEKSETTLDELMTNFGEPVAELVYWLTDSERGSDSAKLMQSAWRLARAPLNAKLVKLADIIDNGTAITHHNPDAAPAFMHEKQVLLKKMADVEGERVLRLPIFQRAAIVINAIFPS